MKLKWILKAWGLLCLFFAAVYIGLALFAESNPYTTFNPGATSLAEWIGMGLISLGLARVIDLLEKK